MTARNVRYAALLLAVCAFGAQADVVTLTDGSRLVGTLERLGGGKLALMTQFAGRIELDATLIESIVTDAPVNVDLSTGDRLVGEITEDLGGEQAIVHTGVGDIPVGMDKVQAIWPQGAKSPDEIAAEEAIVKVQEDAAKKIGKWSTSIEAGVTNQEGNTDTLNAMGRMVIEHKSIEHLLQFYLRGQYGEVNDARNTAEVVGGVYYEHNFTDRLFAFMRNEAEYDEFEDIEFRYTLSLGPGYYWIKQDDHMLKTRAGLGFLHESYLSDTEELNACQGEVGVDYMVELTKWLKLTHATTWYPTFQGLDDYRLVSDTAAIMPLGTSDKWKFKIGALYQYNSIPQPGRERLDETYYANILLELK